MKYRELKDWLAKQGCEFAKPKGARIKVYNPMNGRQSVLHYHPSHEVPKGTYEAILEQLGLK